MEITTVGLDIRQAGLPAARRRCSWQGSFAAEAATVGGAGILQGSTALFGRH